jgi:hypothetical protein
MPSDSDEDIDFFRRWQDFAARQVAARERLADAKHYRWTVSSRFFSWRQWSLRHLYLRPTLAPAPPLASRSADGPGYFSLVADRLLTLQGPPSLDLAERAAAAAEGPEAAARTTPKVKFTGLTQTLGQLQQPLIGILS